MSDTSAKRAPQGFTIEQWHQFMRDGYLLFDNVLSDEQCDRYIEAIDRTAAADAKYDSANYYGPQNVVERDPALVDLIDRETHVGYAYDLFGELTKVHLTQAMRRPPGGWHNLWHPDGARGLPFQVFSPHLPMQMKVGYWLTDLPRPGMGNLVILPGSHASQYMDSYDTHDSVPGEKIVQVKRGAMTIMHCSTWHRVEPNESDVNRYNVFLAYCPGWIGPEDRYQNDPDWLATLSREQRILMRSHSHPYTNTKAPADHCPLYLDRDTGLDSDEGAYRDHVTLNRRKRLTFHEKLGDEAFAHHPAMRERSSSAAHA